MGYLINIVLFLFFLVLIDENIKRMVKIKNYYIRGVILLICILIHFCFLVVIPSFFNKEGRERLAQADFWSFHFDFLMAAINGSFVNSKITKQNK